jgi:hypothetical protein
MILFLSLLIFMPKILAGLAIAHVLWQETDLPAMVLKLALSVPLGLSTSAGLFFLAAWIGIPPHIYSWLEFVTALGISFLLIWKMAIAQRMKFEYKNPSWQDLLGISILLAGAALAIGAFLYYARQHPYGFEDAWSIWNLPARTIVRQNSADILRNSSFYNRFHPDYPVAISLNVAWGWFIMGRELSRVPIAIELLSTFTPALIVFATLNRWKSSRAGMLAALVVLISPDIASAVGQYADPLLVLHMLAAAALLYGYMKSRSDGLMLLAGLLAGYSAWVKNEGILFIVVFVIVVVLAALKKVIDWKALKYLAFGLLIPIMVVALFKLVVASQNDILRGNSSLYEKIFDFPRWVLIAKSFAAYITAYANWPISIILVLFIYALLVGFDTGETRYQLLILLLAVGQIAGYFFIYLITPHDLALHIGTSIKRLVFHIFPILILWLFIALRVPTLESRELAE